MSELLGVTVDDLVASANAREVRIPSEIGAFVALEVSEALLSGPARVRSSDVRIAEDGTISVFVPPGSATSEEAARSVALMLSSLLSAAGTGVPKGLAALLSRGPSSGRWELSTLRDDLEAALVPLNRAAARRVLSRMLREGRRSAARARAISTGWSRTRRRPRAARRGDGSSRSSRSWPRRRRRWRSCARISSTRSSGARPRRSRPARPRRIARACSRSIGRASAR
ncbi:MAG: hypothetical protein K8H88_11880 [Sandaracinaceae bacterium]|nr:hypothetical protein [Sandaracinaceae bacterium]